jgi:hypothetical protein
MCLGKVDESEDPEVRRPALRCRPGSGRGVLGSRLPVATTRLESSLRGILSLSHADSWIENQEDPCVFVD